MKLEEPIDPERMASSAFSRSEAYVLPDNSEIVFPPEAFSIAQELGLAFEKNPISDKSGQLIRYPGIETDVAITLYLGRMDESELKSAYRRKEDLKFEALQWINGLGHKRGSDGWNGMIATALQIWNDLWSSANEADGDGEPGKHQLQE